MGPEGIKEVAGQSAALAHYAAKEISAIPGYELVYDGEFFHEFVTKCPVCRDKLSKKLEEKGMLGGLALDNADERRLLWCFTEMNTKAEIDSLVAILKEGV